ncbi:MAG: hypothetical protein M3378_06485 [Actinomycetota bacterium]|nr:hypothetical protein [Actinomycetota bacterium]
MGATRRCGEGHSLGPGTAARCGTCRVEALVAVVGAACPEMADEQLRAALETTITSAAVARDLATALEAGPEVVRAGAPPVVGRLVGELRARGSSLPVPACATCGRTGRPLVRVGTTGVCPRCRSHQLAEACSGCGRVRVVISRGSDGAPSCAACAPRPARPCGRCGRIRPIARRGRDGEDDICDSCFRPPVATCCTCGRRRPCWFVSAGHPTCASCSPKAVATCAHCAKLRAPCAHWPEGPVCEACYRAALSRRGMCEGCGEERRLVSPPGAGARLCCDCAGVPSLARCKDCGIEERLYADGRCVRCALADRSARLLGGPRPELLAVHQSIVAARQPYSAHNWLRRAGGAEILAEMASGTLGITHEALDAHPRPGAARYVRQMLVAGDVLAARDEALVALEAWVADRVETVEDPEHRRLLRAYATWGVLRRVRQRAEQAKAVRTPTRQAKTRLAAAISFLAFLAGRHRALADAEQGDIEAWLGEGPASAHEVKDFLSWAAQRKLTGRFEIPSPPLREGTALDDEERWAIVGRLLHDDGLCLTDRVVGCLVLLYAQQLSRIVAMTVDQVITADDDVYLRLGTGRALVPEPMGSLVVELVATGRPYVGLGSPSQQSWLFPGLHPGRPLHPGHLGERLAKLGLKQAHLVGDGRRRLR